VATGIVINALSSSILAIITTAPQSTKQYVYQTINQKHGILVRIVGKARQGRAGQGRAGQGRAEQDRAGQGRWPGPGPGQGQGQGHAFKQFQTELLMLWIVGSVAGIAGIAGIGIAVTIFDDDL